MIMVRAETIKVVKTIDPRPVDTSVNPPAFAPLQIPYDSIDTATGLRYAQTVADLPIDQTQYYGYKSCLLRFWSPALLITDCKPQNYRMPLHLDMHDMSGINLDADLAGNMVLWYNAAVKAYRRYTLLVQILAGYGIIVTLDEGNFDAYDITILPQGLTLSIRYNPRSLPAPKGYDNTKLSFTPSGVAERDNEVLAISEIIYDTLQRPTAGSENTWLDTILEYKTQPDATDNTVSKTYTYLQPTIKTNRLDTGYPAGPLRITDVGPIV